MNHTPDAHLLVDSIVPAVEGVDVDLPLQAQLACAVEANVRWQVAAIRDSPEGRVRLASRTRTGGVASVGRAEAIEPWRSPSRRSGNAAGRAD